MRESTLSSEYIYKGDIINLKIDTVQLPDNKIKSREIVEHNGAVAIIAVDKTGKLVLVKQYRKAVDVVLIEIPAGKIEGSENPDDCAIRELIEETGYKPNKIERILTTVTSPGFCTEKIYMYYAEDLEPAFLECDSDEFIDVIKLSVEEAIAMIYSGQIIDAKTIICLFYYYNKKRDELI